MVKVPWVLSETQSCLSLVFIQFWGKNLELALSPYLTPPLILRTDWLVFVLMKGTFLVNATFSGRGECQCMESTTSIWMMVPWSSESVRHEWLQPQIILTRMLFREPRSTIAAFLINSDHAGSTLDSTQQDKWKQCVCATWQHVL